ncbi:hypothetical protein N7U49_24910 [Streptomyces sp. AD2-2]|nr:hypothetical protein N7U49_24910 [Streptomyces sp. AD2-2]
MIDNDGSKIGAPSEKEGTHATYRGFLGHHVFVATCDNTGESATSCIRAT